jgi:UDP-2,3-diacylglucosamine pyrophosphatase LpxH
MLGDPVSLCSFLDQVADYRPPAGERTELVINGDFVDFLALSPNLGWTATENEAKEKLINCFGQFPLVFEALARAVNRVDYVTILLGNHDIELAYPGVRRELFRKLETNEHRCLFIGDNQAYRLGDLHIEHGNRYDSFNAVDYDGLRHAVSALSRGEESPEMEVCPGSQLVEQMVAPLKKAYPFVDLLKPETKVLPLLLIALEPSKMAVFQDVITFADKWWKQLGRLGFWRLEIRQSREKYIAGSSYRTGLPKSLVDDFPELTNPPQGTAPGDGVADSINYQRPIAAERLKKIQSALRYVLKEDRTFQDDSEDGPYLDAAKGLVARPGRSGWVPPQIVVMGHTHAIRNVSIDNGTYLNTGAWVDMIRANNDCLANSEAGRAALEAWLTDLILSPDSLRSRRQAFADVTLHDDGTIAQPDGRPMLRVFSRDEPCFP